MVNKAGKTVAPTMDAFQAAAANADWNSQPGYGVILANQPGDKSWPMTAATWILLYKKPQDAATTGEALKFFAWSYAKGGKMAEDLDYVPMPASSSMAMAIGRRRIGGQSSVRKNATMSPTGTAISMAMAEVTSVP